MQAHAGTCRHRLSAFPLPSWNPLVTKLHFLSFFLSRRWGFFGVLMIVVYCTLHTMFLFEKLKNRRNTIIGNEVNILDRCIGPIVIGLKKQGCVSNNAT